jgi:hypothetical protein
MMKQLSAEVAADRGRMWLIEFAVLQQHAGVCAGSF